MHMIKQCKGKDLAKVPISKLGNIFYVSVKYDGHYVQIHKRGDKVKFFTSGGKEFYHETAAQAVLSACEGFDCILEAEFIADTDGRLGSRGKAAKLTTYRTNFEKGIENIGLNLRADKFKVFDMIAEDIVFDERIRFLEELNFNYQLELVKYHGPYGLQKCKSLATEAARQGYEGLYLKAPSHKQQAGKRVNDAIKLKIRPTADLLCVDINLGEGKYEGMIGSLVLRDSNGRLVNVGSGIPDNLRRMSPFVFIGEVVEIEYEQIQETYIQPTFVQVRYDKTKKDID